MVFSWNEIFKVCSTHPVNEKESITNVETITILSIKMLEGKALFVKCLMNKQAHYFLIKDKTFFKIEKYWLEIWLLMFS